MKKRVRSKKRSTDLEDLEKVCLTLKWNWRKKPADPEFRAQIATALRECRAEIFRDVSQDNRRAALSNLYRMHRRSKATTEKKYLKAESVIRSTYEKMVAEFCLWRFCGWRFDRSSRELIPPPGSAGLG